MRIGCRHPGDGLDASGVKCFRTFSNDIIDLINGLERFIRIGVSQIVRRAIREKTLVVGVRPLTCYRIDPMVMNALADLLPVGFEFLRPAGKVFVDSRFVEGIVYRESR